MAAPSDIIGVIDACYDLEQDEGAWMSGVVAAAQPLIDRGGGVLSFLYDASDPARMQITRELALGKPEAFGDDLAKHAVGQLDGPFVQRTFRSIRCELGRGISQGAEHVWEHLFNPAGVKDVFIVNGCDPSGRGFFLSALLLEPTKLRRRTRARWGRVGAHLAAGYRLRRRLADSPGESPRAIVQPNGVVAHAEPELQSRQTLHALRDAALAREASRGRLRRSDPDIAVEGWKGLIAAQWTLVDRFESDGKRYLLARENDVTLTALNSLSVRERQAVGYAAIGHSNKLIAYEMGLSSSTVGVLLHRAASKLRVRSRDALVAAFVRATTPET